MTGPGETHALVGRAEELGRLHLALRAALTHRSSVILCSGEPGIGRTALLQRFVREVADQGMTVLWPSSFGRPAVPPYWTWRHVVEVGRMVHPPASAADHAALAQVVAQRLRLVVAGGGAVLVLDDADLADGASIAL